MEALDNSGNKLPKAPFIVILVLLVLAVAVLIIFGKDLNKHLPVNIRTPEPQTTTENFAISSAEPLKVKSGPSTFVTDNCTIVKEGNPLVTAVDIIPNEDTVAGALLGNINQITASGDEFKIDLLSPTASQRYIFEIKTASRVS